MHANIFIQDMALIMIIAGFVTIIFNRLKQPVVLGYIVAGIIIGPFTPQFLLIHDKETINVLAELGVVFLMFSLGLEFSLKKLAKVGFGAFIIALFKISAMIYIGYQLGVAFGWKPIDSLFLGAILSISSTTIIVKALSELRMKQEKFAQLIYGILIIEDILAIAIIALLSGIATTGTVSTSDIMSIFGKLSLFIIVALVLGLLLIPRLIGYVTKFRSNEMLLITVLGLCFGFCLLVIKLDYSIALGAFIIGAIIAEAKALSKIEALVEPVRDMFCAIFFVTIGMLFNPSVFLDYAWPVIIITVVVIIGKILFASLGAFLAGQNGRTSLQVGMGLVPIGEFSFIIASLGLSLKVTSNFLYPIVVAVSAITTLLTPYLIKAASPLSNKMLSSMPVRVTEFVGKYPELIKKVQPQGDSAIIGKIISKIILQIIINCALVAAVFIASVFLVTSVERGLFGIKQIIANDQLRRVVVCSSSLFLSLPFLIAAYRKLKAFSMIFSEIIITGKILGAFYIKIGCANLYRIRRIVYEILPIICISLITALILSFSHQILPEPFLLSLVILAILIIAIVLWKPFVWLQSWLQIALFNVMEENADKTHH